MTTYDEQILEDLAMITIRKGYSTSVTPAVFNRAISLQHKAGRRERFSPSELSWIEHQRQQAINTFPA